MSTHTPGPSDIHKQALKFMRHATGRDKITWTINSQANTVKDQDGRVVVDLNGVALSDARLIAAAPRMLDSLRLMAQWGDTASMESLREYARAILREIEEEG